MNHFTKAKSLILDMVFLDGRILYSNHRLETIIYLRREGFYADISITRLSDYGTFMAIPATVEEALRMVDRSIFCEVDDTPF